MPRVAVEYYRPNITKRGDEWHCTHAPRNAPAHITGRGQTPAKAYKHWLFVAGDRAKIVTRWEHA